MAVPTFYADTLRDPIATFNDDNPGIQIELVSAQAPTFGGDQAIDEYLDNMADYASEADILLLSGLNQPLALPTRAGYFLDMNSLVSADPDFSEDEFFQALWQSFQWEGGLWAMPVSGDVTGLVYDPSAFEEAGLPVPSDNWSLTEFRSAAEAFATYDDDGNVTEAGVQTYTPIASVLVTVADATLYDPLAIDIDPEFDVPALQDIISQWIDITDDDLVSAASGGGLELPPLAIAPSSLTGLGEFTGTEYGFAPLPGGDTFVTPQGLAISAGTQNAEAAYQVVKYMTSDLAAQQAFIGAPIPARRSLFGQELEGDDTPQITLSLPQAIEEQVLTFIESARPNSDLLFSNYLFDALTAIREDDASVESALQEAELNAEDALQVAAERDGAVTVAVPTQVPQRQIDEGEVALTFGYFTFGNEIPRRSQLEDYISTYLENSDAAGDITLDRISVLAGDQELADYADRVDCFYHPTNLVPDEDLSLLLPLDPLIASDLQLNRDDFVADTLVSVQDTDRTYALPLHIQPEVMLYDAEQFEQANVDTPQPGWDISAFEQTLRGLAENSADDEAPFRPGGSPGTTYQTLIVAYGGLPIDYSTSPPTLDYTSEANVNAIRDVLDLAKEGLINYNALGADLSFGGFGGGAEDPPLTSQVLTPLFEGLFNNDDSLNITTYPQGTDYTVLTYTIGAGYITSSTNNAAACYDFLSNLSGQPQLLTGVPARQSQLETAALDESINTTGDFYTTYADQLQAPNRVSIPSSVFTSTDEINGTLLALWLYQAMDAYVLEDANLETELAEAEELSQAYLQCTAEIPPYDPNTGTDIEYVQQFAECAVQVDPAQESIFGPVLNQGGDS
jgi:ABC-type glycerol-3-phosphate transport system substrate-binding protein